MPWKTTGITGWGGVKERALDYIREQAGKFFDPALTELFLSKDWK